MRAFVIPSIFTAIDKFSSPVEKMTTKMSAFAATTERNFRNAGKSAFAVGRTAGKVGLAIAVPLGVAAKQAVEFEDKMSDVAKTTGFQGKELEKFGNALLSMSTKTRSSLDDLAQIAEIGGQLGIAKKDMTGFVDAANKFNVALGKDFAGGVEEAITSVGKMKTLFSDTKGLNVSEGIMRTGSAINQLGAVGAATSSNISDFALRIGALPDMLKPTAQNTLALGAYFEELGLNAQIASGGMTDLLLHAGKQIGGFASQMKMSGQAAKEMLKNDPTEFAKRFAKSFKGMSAEAMTKKLAEFSIGSQETIKVIGALGANTERLTELQNVSAKSFAENTSLINEYNIKNNNTAAQLAKLKNNFQALAIQIGTAVLPIIQSLVDIISPYVQRISAWISRNKELTGTIVKVAAVLAGLAFGISAIAFTIGIYQKAVVIAQAAQWLWNAAMAANPIGLIIIGVAALIALIVQVVRKWDEWGAAVTLFLGPIGLVISMIMTLRKHWSGLVSTFKTDGIIAGFKRLGAIILDVLLYPMQQFLKLVSKIPGLGHLAGSGAQSIEKMRESMGLTEVEKTDKKPIVNAEKRRIEAENGKKGENGKIVVDFKNMPNGVQGYQEGGKGLFVPQSPSTR